MNLFPFQSWKTTTSSSIQHVLILLHGIFLYNHPWNVRQESHSQLQLFFISLFTSLIIHKPIPKMSKNSLFLYTQPFFSFLLVHAVIPTVPTKHFFPASSIQTMNVAPRVQWKMIYVRRDTVLSFPCFSKTRTEILGLAVTSNPSTLAHLLNQFLLYQ